MAINFLNNGVFASSATATSFISSTDSGIDINGITMTRVAVNSAIRVSQGLETLGLLRSYAGLNVAQTATFGGNVNINSVFDFNTSTDLLTITNNQNTGGINLSGGNSRIYFGGSRAIEGAQNGTNLTFAEGYTTTYILSNTVVQGNLEISSTIPKLSFIDLQQDDWDIINDNGEFKLLCSTGTGVALQLNTDNSANFAGDATVDGKLKVANRWDNSTLANNAIYAQNTTDGFAFGVGTQISTWFAWDNTAGQNDMISVYNDGSRVTIHENLYLGNIDTSSDATSALVLNSSGTGEVERRTLGTGAFGPTPVGAYLPLSGGSGTGQAMTGNLHIQNSGAKIYLKDTTDDDDQAIYFQNNANTIEYIISTQDFTGSGAGDGMFIGSSSSDELALVTNNTTALYIDTSQNSTFAGDVSALRFDMNPDYAASPEYMSISKAQNQDGGILLKSKPTGGSGRLDWQIINHGTTGNLRFYAYGLGGNSLILDRANGNATFAGDVGLGGTGLYTTSHSLNIDGTGLAIKNNVNGSNNNWSHITNSATASSSNLVFTTGSGIALTLAHNTAAAFAGKITANGGINGLTLANGGITGSNYDITGVNQLVISDPGEGIVFTGTATMYLNAVDDATDSILKLTNATQLNLNSTARITNLVNPTGAQDAATKNYVDTEIGNIPSGLAFEGNWNASTDTPTLAGTTQDNGKFWIVTVAGSTNLSGITDWAVGDWAIYVDNGAGTDAWQKVDNSSSLAGAGSAGKVTFWSSTSNVSFNTNFSYDGTNLTVPRLRVGDGTDGYFYSDSAGRTAFAAGDFYIQNSVNNYYNYATNIYLGNTTGDTVLFRGSTITATNWSITPAGAATFGGNVTATNILTVAGAATGSPFLQFTQGGTQKAYIQYVDSGDSFELQSDNQFVVRTGGSTTALTINSSQNATFTGDLTVIGNLSAAGYNIFGLGLSTGTWYGDLGSNGYTRETGLQMTSGSEFVVVSKNGQGSTLVDGAYLAYESSNGFFGSYNSTYGNLTGIRATAANTLTVTQLDGGTANLAITSIANATTDTDKFLVSDSGVVKYRTGAQVLSDIGAQASGNYLPIANPTFTGTLTGPAATITTVTGALAGNASTSTTFSTGRTNYKGVTDAAVIGMMMWKNYGNNHTIFDASNGTSPSGSTISNTNSAVAWSATYPTLMGWNGSSTYGVRVDRARLADSATTAAAYLPLAGGNMSGQIDAETIEFDGIVNSSAVGALIGRNHAYDTLELRGHGAELMIGSKNQDLHINYRTCNNGAANNTPINWFWRAGSSSSFSNHSFGTVTATGLNVNTFSNNAGNLIFSAGNATTGAGRSLNLRITSPTTDPSSSDDSNSTGITWGQRTDSNPYYIIYPNLENWNSSGNYSKLTLAWHTGIKIGAASQYGGTRFYNNSPDISGAGVIMNVGVGNNNIGVVNNLTVGGQATGPAPTTTTSYANKAYVDTAVAGAGSGTFLPLAGGTMANTNLVTNMNADLLDGISSASFLRSDAVDIASQRITFIANQTNNWDTIATAAGSQGGIEIFNTGSGNDAFMAFHAGNDYAFYFGIDADNNQLSVGGWSMGANKYKVWNESNDGAGSGLDADLLDGLQATSFLRSDAADTSTGEILFDAGFKSDSILLSGAQNFDNIARSGFYNLYNTNVAGSTGSPGFDYGTMIVVGGNKQNASFGLQIAHERTGSGMYVRGMNDSGSTWYAWDEIWNSGNDGAGSGLDADLLDGQHGSYYLNYANFTGTPTIPSVGNGTFTVTGNTGLSGSGSMTANQSGASSATLINTDRGSSQAIYKNFTASSGGTATANSNNDTLTIAAGTNVTTVRSGDTITINTSATTNTGTVTSIATGGGLDGGTITTAGTIEVEYAGVPTNIIQSGFDFTGDTVVPGDYMMISDPGQTSTNRRIGYVTVGDLPKAPQTTFTRTINASTYTMLCTVEGDRLASIVDLTITGTSSGVVMAASFEIIVNHYEDIHVRSLGGDYTDTTIRITSNNNEDYSIEAKAGGGSNTTVEVCVFPRANEIINPTTTDPGYTGEEYVHTATEGWRFGGEDGNTTSARVAINGALAVGNTFPSKPLTVNGTIRAEDNNSGDYIDITNDGSVSGHSKIETSSGNLIVDPAGILDVQANAVVTTSNGVGDLYLGNYATAKHFRFHTNNNQTYFDMNCGQINWREGSSTRYYFYPSTANMTINGTLTQNSDSRVKENVVEIDDCIGKVQAMKGVYYNRTDFNTDVTKVGVIAQDVEAVLPELILEAPDTGLKSVAYAELTAVLINAIKEQQEIIDDLKTRVQQLEK